MTRGIILLYHRIGEPGADPWALTVTPEHFAAHLEVLRRECRVVLAADLDGTLRDARSTVPIACVTLDDGYRLSLTTAAVLLRRLEIPATLFLPTGFFGTEREFWWDDLARILLEPHPLPPVLRLRMEDGLRQWILPDAGRDDPTAAQRDWRAWMDPPGPRQQLYRELYVHCQRLAPSRRQEILDDLLTWASLDQAGRPAYRCVTTNDVRVLAHDDLLEIAAHSVTHPVLSALAEADQRAEMSDSKVTLEQLIRRPVVGFAYPYGQPADYTANTVLLVQRAGFAYACSSVPGPVEEGTDRFRLPRLFVEDWGAEEFGRRLLR